MQQVAHGVDTLKVSPDNAVSSRLDNGRGTWERRDVDRMPVQAADETPAPESDAQNPGAQPVTDADRERDTYSPRERGLLALANYLG